MTDVYNDAVAEHYAAYRPPLHRMILERVLGSGWATNAGLDVGCGTGTSAVALTHFCDVVFGVEPSQAMLQSAAQHPRIRYLQGAASDLPLPDESVDLVTFAGSLFYANTAATVQELVRVCRPNAFVVPYDFEVLLEPIWSRLGFRNSNQESNYNHQENFANVGVFEELLAADESITLLVRTSELAHLLLSDSERHAAFADRYQDADPYAGLVAELDSKFDQESSDEKATEDPLHDQSHPIETRIFYSKYQLISD